MSDTPLLAGQQSLLEGVGVQQPPSNQSGQHPVEHMGFIEGLAMGAEKEWLFPSIQAGVHDETFVADPEWKNPVLSDPDIPLGFRENLTRARSQEHYDAIKDQLAEEMTDHQRLQAATGFGTAGYMLAAMADPALLVALPFEELAIGAKILQAGKIARIIKAGAVAGTSNALIEAGVGAQKETRGLDDIAIAGATGFAFGGLLRGGADLLTGNAGIRKELDGYVSHVVDGEDTFSPPARIDKAEVVSDPLKKVGPTDQPQKATYSGNAKFMAEAAAREEQNITSGGAKAYEWSVGERLRSNRNGIISALGDRLTEYSPGYGGKKVRAMTADIRNTLFQRMMGSTYADYDNLYKQWYTANGYSWRNARLAGKGREEFGEAVLRELDARAAGRVIDSHPLVRETADSISARYNETSLNIQKKAGVLNADKVDHNPNYYPRQWDYEKMFNMGEENVKTLIARSLRGAYIEMSEADSKTIANSFWRRFHDKYTSNSGANSHMFNADTRDTFQDYLMDILDEDTVQEIMQKITPVRGAEKAPGQLHTRIDLDMTATLDDGRSVYDLIETDYGLLLSRQSRDVSGRAALAEVGIKSDKDWEQLIKLARDRIGDDPALKADTHKGIRDLEIVRRALLGQSTVLNPNSRVARTARALRDITHLSRMGQMGMAQATEMANLVAEQGIPSIVKGIPQMRRMEEMVRNGTLPDDLAQDLAALGWKVGDEHLMNIPYYRAEDGGLKVSSYGDTPSTARWKNSLQEGKRLLGYVSLQNGIMRKEQKLWLHSTLVRFYEDATGGSKLSTKRMYDMGFDDRMISRIRDNIKRNGGKFEDQGIVSLGFDKWDEDVLDTFRTGLMRQNGQAIQQNMVGDMPAWAMGSSAGQLLAQFRSFPMVAWSKQLKRQAKFMDATSFGTIAYGVPICAAIHYAKTHLNSVGMGGKERRDYLKAQLSDKGLALGVVRYLPVATLIPDAAAGMAPVLGMDFSSPYRAGTTRATDMSIGALGPSLGYINDARKSVTNLINPNKDMKAKDWRKLLRLAPFANTLGTVNIINGISSSLAR